MFYAKYGVTAFMHAVSPRAKWKFDAFELFEDCKVDISIRDTVIHTSFIFIVGFPLCESF